MKSPMSVQEPQRIVRLLRGERGGAMVAVLGLMGVTMVIGVTVTASTINAVGITSSTRAATQARAAAEAGIDRALVDVQTTCVTTFASTTDPVYNYTLEYKNEPADWAVGCPPDDADYIKILSTGFASDPGTAGATSGDSVLLEAIYAYVPIYTEVPQFDPAVYAHAIEGTLQNLQLSTASATIQADVHIKNGNVICTNGANVQGSILLGNGYAHLDRCHVTGSIHASKYIYVTGNSSDIGKGLYANGDGVAEADNVITVHNYGTVIADIVGEGNILIEGQAEGDVTANGTTTSKVTINSSGAKVFGDVVSSGAAEVKNNGSVNGTISQNVTGLAPLSYPRIPEWTDITYPTNSPWDGYHVMNWSGSCDIGSNHTFWASLTSASATHGKILVDAMAACGASGLTFRNNIDLLLLSGNMTFIAQNFLVDKLYVDSADGPNYNMWFMVPDNVTEELPTPSQYSGNCNVYLTNEADFQPAISAFVYTPCKITSDRDKWRGQFYGGTMEFMQQAIMTFVPVGVPGVDFDASLPPILVVSDGVLGGRVSLREMADGS